MGPRSANSRSRSRLSCAFPNPETIHWRTFPERWSTRLPALLEAAFGLHQISFSDSILRHRMRRGIWYTARECCDSARNDCVNSDFPGFMTCFPPAIQEVPNVQESSENGFSHHNTRHSTASPRMRYRTSLWTKLE